MASFLRRLVLRRIVGVALAFTLVGAAVGIAAATVTSNPGNPGPFVGCLSLADGSISQVAPPPASGPFGGVCTNGDDMQISFGAGVSVSRVWHIEHSGGGGATAAGFADESLQDIPAGLTITYDGGRTGGSFVGNVSACTYDFRLFIQVSDQALGTLVLRSAGNIAHSTGVRVDTTPHVTVRGTTGLAHWHAVCRTSSSTYIDVPDFSIDVYFRTDTTSPFS
jgi:hypothetical protein